MKSFLPFVIIFILFTCSIFAKQSPVDFNITNLQLDLALNVETANVSGTAVYTVEPFHENATEIILLGHELDFRSVLVNGEESEFEVSGDTLRVEASARGTIEIEYSSTNGNGIIQTHEGVFMSSTQNGLNRGWFPTIDSQWFSFNFELNMRVPAGYEVIAPGNFVRQINNEDGSRTQQWRSDVPVPSNKIGFVTGDLTFEEALSGIKTVRVYTTSVTNQAVNRNQLLRHTASAIGNIQRDLRFEYPFDGFSVVILDDHYWQTIPFNAGYGLAYLNAGNIESQINNLVDAQWFGVLNRDLESAKTSPAFLMALAAEAESNQPKITLDTRFLPNTNNDLDAFDMANRFDHLSAFTELPLVVRRTMLNERQEFVRSGNRILVWDDLVNRLYTQTGQIPALEMPEREDFETEEPDSIVVVDLAIDYIGAENRINLIVSPAGRVDSDSITIPLIAEFRGGSEERPLTVFRNGGEFSLSVSNRPQNVKVDRSQVKTGIEFVEIKEMDMWLHQLRNDQSPEMRSHAAMNLSRFRDEPDLQLALSDFLRREDNSEVRATIIRSTSDLIGAAQGTEQTFISMISDAGDKELVAIVDALMNYQGNADAIRAVENIALQSSNTEAAAAAVTALRIIGDEDDFFDIAVDILLGNRPQQVKAAVIRELFRMGDMVVAVDTTVEIILGDFPYLMRKTGLEMLVNYELQDAINEVFPELAKDRDPRIRYFVLQHADRLDARQMNDLLESRFFSEIDERVRLLFDAF